MTRVIFCGILQIMLQKIPGYLVLAVLCCSCLGRYSKPPSDDVAASVFREMPETISAIGVSEGRLYACAGRWLYLQGSDIRQLVHLQGNAGSAAVLSNTLAVVENGSHLILYRIRKDRLEKVSRQKLPEPIPLPVVATAGGFLLCGNRGGVYYKPISSEKLKVVWTAQKGIAAAPRRTSDGFCVVSFSRECVFLDSSGNKVLREVRLPAIPDSTPLVENGELFYATRDLRFLRTTTGGTRIAAARRVRSWANRVTLLNKRPLYRTWHGDLVSLDPATLKDYWRYASGVRLTLPLVDGYRLFCGARDGMLRILYRPNGGLIGRIRLGSQPVLPPILYRGHVLAACGKTVYRIRAKRKAGIE